MAQDLTAPCGVSHCPPCCGESLQDSSGETNAARGLQSRPHRSTAWALCRNPAGPPWTISFHGSSGTANQVPATQSHPQHR